MRGSVQKRKIPCVMQSVLRGRGVSDSRVCFPGVGLDEDLQYVVGGHCRWVGVMEPIVQFALFYNDSYLLLTGGLLSIL